MRVGANPRFDSRNERILAHGRVDRIECIAATHTLCEREFAGIVPNQTVVPVYHFRTPSPDGQQTQRCALLPVTFLGGRFARELAQQGREWRSLLFERAKRPCVAGRSQDEQEGSTLCLSSKLVGFCSRFVVALQRVATRLANRPLRAAWSARGPQPWSMAASQRVQPSGPQATWSSVRPTRAAATRRPAASLRARTHQTSKRHGMCFPARPQFLQAGLRAFAITTRGQGTCSRRS